ncbi:MAG TPA: vanadium-dependent haloperoxidase [Micromonosporaceae bacterium]|nr:vanadium-dependent haloperoxidase [Micromonosporaceae bacterium]
MMMSIGDLRRRRWRATAVGTLALSLLGAAAPATAAQAHGGHRSGAPTRGPAEPVLTWNAHAEQATSAGRPPASTFVLLGITHIAIYDTAVALGLPARPYLARQWAPPDTSAAAAVATAAYDVLAARVPAQRSFLDPTYANYLAAIPDTAAKQHGIALGRRVAEQVLAWRTGDGLNNVVTWTQPSPGPGVWEPTAPTPPVDLVLTQVRPLGLRTNDQFRPAGPPALTSREYARDVDEAQRLGRVDSTERTAYQTETARFWSDQTAVQWNRTVRQVAADRGLNLGQAARLLAMVHLSTADAAIACWDAKFAYVSWRPVHAIQRADTDGNPATVADRTWQPLLNANHPEYTSGHACVSTAATTALGAYFDRSDLTVTVRSTTTGTARTYHSLSAILDDVTVARIAAGLHFRYAMRDGERLGRRVATWLLDRHFCG